VFLQGLEDISSGVVQYTGWQEYEHYPQQAGKRDGEQKDILRVRLITPA
jgi:hypothetical protein